MTFPNIFRAAGALLVASLFAAAPVSAQDLKMGSPAPALSVEEWLKGEPVASFAPGHVYVVEFWATWCPPCLTSIPHLTELQKKYADSKVTIIGIAGSERAKSKGADLRAPLVKFIADQGDKMAYTVAFDNDRSMSKGWMEPARQDGIPVAFIVDGTGTIAWIGYPMLMDDVLAKVVAGKWDVKARVELEAKLQPIIERASKAADSKDWDGALAALDEAMALGDEAVRQLAWFKYNMHLEKKDFDGGYAFIAKGLKGALADEADLLNAVAYTMVDAEQAPRFEKKDHDLALACAQRACEITKGKAVEAMHLATLAAVHFALGDAKQAVEVQTRAISLAKDKPQIDELTKKLELYKKSVKS